MVNPNIRGDNIYAIITLINENHKAHQLKPTINKSHNWESVLKDQKSFTDPDLITYKAQNDGLKYI